jgi:hypothetical protein
MLVYTLSSQLFRKLPLAATHSPRHVVQIMKKKVKSKSKPHYDRQSVGQSVLVSGAHLGPEVEGTLRPTVSRPVRLGVLPLLVAGDQMLHLFE